MRKSYSYTRSLNQLHMWVKDYMYTKTHTIGSDETIKEALRQMVHDLTNSLIVVDEQFRPIGIISSQILIKEAVPEYLKDDPTYSQFGPEGMLEQSAQSIADRAVKDFMYTDFHSLKESDAIIEAATYSIDAYRRVLPVIDDMTGRLVGSITRTCIKNALYNALFPDDQVKPTNGSVKKDG